ncbi:hypothetical protein GF357_04045 [Candidatus Dojkabacteria bacterium]|nr:hypothetical protein [Candidatus Dojkabacteria bacterium]
MRLWSISPKYLDSKGLVALWRETLLAKAVLENKTSGYRNHPQLQRFKNSENPVQYINKYLEYIYKEALDRGYNFDQTKFRKEKKLSEIPVTNEQIEYEFRHLLKKLKIRDPNKYHEIKDTVDFKANELFCIVPGGIEDWEVIS